VFAWYHLAGALATAAGAWACGAAVEALRACGAGSLASYRAVLIAYATTGLFLAQLFTRLSPAAEVGARQPGGAVAPARGSLLGLHRSPGVVLGLSALFALDAFAGGFVLQSIMAYWFHARFGANLLAGAPALAAAGLARRVGLLRTMVYTHLPSNLLLMLVPLLPTLPSAVVVVLLLRFAISQMDVPARQSYTAAVVSPEERSAAAGITGVARTTGAALAPALACLLLVRRPPLRAVPRRDPARGGCAGQAGLPLTKPRTVDGVAGVAASGQGALPGKVFVVREAPLNAF
jgi:hypothetical protein